MKKLRCILGLHNNEIISNQETVESDYDTGTKLTRIVMKCNNCGKITYKRTDDVIFINDYIASTWTWKDINK